MVALRKELSLIHISVGTVTTGEPGSQATASLTPGSTPGSWQLDMTCLLYTSLADYKRVYDNGYSPTRLSGLAVTNNPDHEAQPGIIRQAAAGDVVVHSRSATISQTTTMSKKATQQRVLHSDDAAGDEEKKKQETNTNNDNPSPATTE